MNLSIKITSGELNKKIIEKLNEKILFCKNLNKFSLEICKECNILDPISKIFKNFRILKEIEEIISKIPISNADLFNFIDFIDEIKNLNLISISLNFKISKKTYSDNTQRIFNYNQISSCWENFK